MINGPSYSDTLTTMLEYLDYFNSDHQASRLIFLPRKIVTHLNNLERSHFTFEAFWLKESASYDIIRNTWCNFDCDNPLDVACGNISAYTNYLTN